MNTIVSFELAKLLKEKGFDEALTLYFDLQDFNKVKPIPMSHEINKFHSNRNSLMLSAPTIAEVIMWFLEKHGIWIYARQVRNPEPLPNYWCGIINKDAKLIDSVEGFYSPSSAYEAAIEHTLKNLIP